MTGGAADIAVIVVNYGTASMALAAVDSVLTSNHGARSVEVHLLDNASPRNDAANLADEIAARGWGSHVRLYREPENRGFGCGNNVVLSELASREAPPELVFLLNPDAKLANDAMAILADFMGAHSDAGAAGARLIGEDGTPSAAAFRFPSIAGEFAEAASFGPITRLLGRWRIPMETDLHTGPVDWVTGAAVMLRFSALEQVGFFDPGYFLYYEEVDLMRRLDRAGWQCWHVSEAKVIHIEGAATALRGSEIGLRRRPEYWYASRRLYSLRSLGRAGAVANGCAVILGAGLNHLHSRLRGRKPWLPERFISDTWRSVLRPLLSGWRPD
ncbi:glycosyltransferase family 2 protein [Aliiruegeria sabulilitoris]|uniref:glycosyltransferase family 2 protein n=1 Tax=Aliiruegeria sabulilitoris TaxID=1510458 RepID=UPI000837193A|nr:glycosyltransferase family 2 protein [Aliiruegeria sabulilitoris]NDR57066.1 glycosyltransferase family 2 protein [Pseudoruegeria sp. M32A2M]